MTTTERPRLLSYLGPNWFSSVMGTGIVAITGATLPVHVPGLRGFAEVVWVVAAVWLVLLIVAVAAHWLRNPTVARSHGRNPQMAHFYGAAPMALLTVGAGAVLVGRDLMANAPPSTSTGCCGPRARSAGCSPRSASPT
jgi:tellurite resistance protein TehA-like permease